MHRPGKQVIPYAFHYLFRNASKAKQVSDKTCMMRFKDEFDPAESMIRQERSTGGMFDERAIPWERP